MQRFRKIAHRKSWGIARVAHRNCILVHLQRLFHASPVALLPSPVCLRWAPTSA
ncbi:hypothetical protein BKA66DRAFT_462938 [Pyrenochaeta sp. MPI-SDFR-AT-0127]|nr:hypothetical protein BKA66DRAFT_462938 [Pyrenochaeta sp. MPI-SDFR-AT-0127]